MNDETESDWLVEHMKASLHRSSHRTLDEALATAARALSPEFVAEIRTCSDPRQFATLQHLGLGLWMRNALNLHHDQALCYEIAVTLGGKAQPLSFSHADDASHLLPLELWRRVRESPNAVPAA